MKRLILLSLVLVSPAFAQEDAEEPETFEGRRVIRPKESRIDFEKEVSVDGTLSGPGIIQVTEARRGVFNPLIKLRVSFDEEMLASVDAVK